MKGPAGVVTATDVKAQALIAHRLRRTFPGHGILAEEGLDKYRWDGVALDRGPAGRDQELRPRDSQFLRAHRYGAGRTSGIWGGLRSNAGRAVHGSPGAWRLVQRSTHPGVWDDGASGGFPRHRASQPSGGICQVGEPHPWEVCRTLPGDSGSGRRALGLRYVACGRFDGYWELDQAPWDIAAGALIAEEAGGGMSNFRGGPFDIFEGEMRRQRRG